MKTIYRLLEQGDIVQDGDEFWDDGLMKWVPSEGSKVMDFPYRRQMNVAEIYGNTVYYGTSPRIAALEKENAELKEKLEAVILSREVLFEEKRRTNQVKWEDKPIPTIPYAVGNYLDWKLDMSKHELTLRHCGYECTIPLPPKKDEAEEAWEKAKEGLAYRDSRQVFKAGYKAAQEANKCTH